MEPESPPEPVPEPFFEPPHESPHEPVRGPFYRLHPLSPFFEIGRSFFRIIVPISAGPIFTLAISTSGREWWFGSAVGRSPGGC